MSYDGAFYLAVFLALWSGVVGGVFSAFSEFVMAALVRTTPSAGIEAMQQINRTVLRTQFVAGILLIPALSIFLAFQAWTGFEGTARTLLVLAPVIFVPSVFLMTLLRHVPMNTRLDELDPASQDAQTYWCEYGRKWTRLNHVRSLGSLATSGIYILAATELIGSGQV